MRSSVAALVCAVLLLAGCTRLVAGTPSGASLDCSRPSAQQIVSCLSPALSKYWTGETGRTITVNATVDPSPTAVPRACRGALALRTAFTCPVDDRVYLTRPFVRRMLATGPPGQGWLRIASTLAHETGHVVQFVVHAPLIGKAHPSLAESRRIEQQADCLGGVWASAAGIAAHAFVAANKIVLRLVDNPRERRTHGTAPARLRAVRRGLTGDPAACGLTLRR
ncbi:MAG TPA: neutral zinc metallopeptidase [Jatrophihabitans sp.]|jgi:predicted metalloprotease